MYKYKFNNISMKLFWHLWDVHISDLLMKSPTLEGIFLYLKKPCEHCRKASSKKYRLVHKIKNSLPSVKKKNQFIMSEWLRVKENFKIINKIELLGN